MAAGRGLGTMLQLGVERLDDFIFVLQLLAEPTWEHEGDDLQVRESKSYIVSKIKTID